MLNLILRINAVPVYSFLSFINNKLEEGQSLDGRKILDCGAGGAKPPVALFSQFGMEPYGIDISDRQLKLADEFCRENNVSVNMIKADARQIPFGDDYFDYVYEQYAICHLTKRGIATAIDEMYRVLKPGGLCMLGMISTETWPQFGIEREKGEFWSTDEEFGEVVHSFFDDDEADSLVDRFEIIKKETIIQQNRKAVKELTLEKWMKEYDDSPRDVTRDEWQLMYSERIAKARYVHSFYYLLK